MDSSNKLKTHKVKRNQAKKRKLEALLNLIRQDDSTPRVKKKSEGTFEENYSALKDELKKYQKKKSPDPVFCIKDDGSSAIVTFPNGETSTCKSPLFVEDLQHLLLTSVLGNLSPFPLFWAKIENQQNVSKTVFLEIEGLSLSDVAEMQSRFNQNHYVFPSVFEVLSSDLPFASELSTFHQTTNYYDESNKKQPAMFPIKEVTHAKTEKPNSYKISKLHLLLSPIQLAMEHFPLPQSVFEQAKSEGYCFSKEKYNPVHKNSPMFAIDCEMCRVLSGQQEVTRIAIVNEKLETIYHTLVKPQEDIIDYATRFSGVTEKMLRHVTTTLKDVQNDIRRLLPSDAILCGQSLNCDLHALKMIHPYVIDTSVIFNDCGIRQKKTSLKRLAQMHLKEKIQDCKSGHNPVEDSVATMKLVQLKLQKSVEYGDAVLTEDPEKSENPYNDKEGNITSMADKTQNTSDSETQNNGSNIIGFFSLLSRLQKKICLIGSDESLSKYNPEKITNNVSLVCESKLNDIIKAAVDNTEKHDLILSHFILNSEDFLAAEIIDKVKQLHDTLMEKTFFVIFLSGIKNLPKGDLRKNYCLVTVKSNKTPCI